jgi:CRP-like cAMP-binding protein
MNSELLLNFLRSITSLPIDLITSLESELHQETYKARQIIHAAGQLENRIFFLQSGFARSYYYDHHGNEHTVKFWESGDIMFSYEGYYSVPSYFYTEIIKASYAITLSYSALHELDKIYPEIGLIIKSLLLQFQQEEYERQLLIALPTEERYRALRKNKQRLFKKLPNRIIASYLHMTRETLTRLISKDI